MPYTRAYLVFGGSAGLKVVTIASPGATRSTHGPVVEMLLEHGTPLVRPDDVLTGLTRLSPAFAPAEIPVLTRLEQGRLDRTSATLAAPGS